MTDTLTAVSGTSCTSCVSGKYTTSSQVACDKCGKGQYAISATVSSCDPCGTGMHQELDVAVAYGCKYCLKGKKFTDKSSVCIDCLPGNYQTSDTHTLDSCTPCTNCAAGRKQTTHSKTSCNASRYGDKAATDRTKFLSSPQCGLNTLVAISLRITCLTSEFHF